MKKFSRNKELINRFSHSPLNPDANLLNRMYMNPRAARVRMIPVTPIFEEDDVGLGKV